MLPAGRHYPIVAPLAQRLAPTGSCLTLPLSAQVSVIVLACAWARSMPERTRARHRGMRLREFIARTDAPTYHSTSYAFSGQRYGRQVQEGGVVIVEGEYMQVHRQERAPPHGLRVHVRRPPPASLLLVERLHFCPSSKHTAYHSSKRITSVGSELALGAASGWSRCVDTRGDGDMMKMMIR